jgi:peptidoglycan/LPS O-acetylase OafA/YrhL
MSILGVVTLTRLIGFFLVQSIVVYTLGIKLYQMLHLSSDMAVVAVCFFVTLATSVGGAEIFYRIVEVPSQVLSHVAFDWIRE